MIILTILILKFPSGMCLPGSSNCPHPTAVRI
jgi:hypothetical protein